MAWLLETFNEAANPEAIKKAIENHQLEMDNDRRLAKDTIANINKQMNERLEKHPEDKKRIEWIRHNKIHNVYKGVEFAEKKHGEAIETLKKEYEKL